MIDLPAREEVPLLKLLTKRYEGRLGGIHIPQRGKGGQGLSEGKTRSTGHAPVMQRSQTSVLSTNSIYIQGMSGMY